MVAVIYIFACRCFVFPFVACLLFVVVSCTVGKLLVGLIDQFHLMRNKIIQIINSPLTVASGRARSGAVRANRTIPRWINGAQWKRILKANDECNIRCRCRALMRIKRVVGEKFGYFPKLSVTKDTQVIYVIYNVKFNRLYVGETMKSAGHRFQEHIRCARAHLSNPNDPHNNYPLAKCIAQSDWRDFRTIPIQKIEGVFRNSKEFSVVARKIERGWMRRLQTQYPEKGWNIVGHKRRNRKGGENPMKWAREKKKELVQSQVVKELPPQNRLQVPVQLQHNAPPPNQSGLNILVRKDEQKILNSLRQINQAMVTGKFSTDKLKDFSSSTLSRMVVRLENYSNDELKLSSAEKGKMLLAQVNRELRSRFPRPVKPAEDKERLIIPFVSKSLNSVRFHAFFEKPFTMLLPLVLREALAAPMVCFHYAKPISQFVYNYRQVSELPNVEIQRIMQQDCICKRKDLQLFVNPEMGHIMTAELGVVSHHKLRDLLSFGTKHRAFCVQTDNPDVAVCDALKSYAMQTADKLHLRENVLDLWLKSCEKEIEGKLRKGNPDEGCSQLGLDRSLQQALRILQKNFVISCVDKSGNDFAFICKKHYVSCVLKELNEKHTYVELKEDPKQLVLLQKRFLQNKSVPGFKTFKNGQENDLEVKPEIPYLYGTFKAHKDSLRFISASHRTPLRNLSVILSNVLKFISPNVNQLWKNALVQAGLTEADSWVVTNSAEVVQKLKALNRTINSTESQQLSTYDFATMYTTIPQEDLIQKIVELVRETFQSYCEEKRIRVARVKVSGSTCTWANENSESKRQDVILDVETFKALFSFLVRSTHVCFGGKVYKQVIGIPMGTNCAVYVANFYLFTYELAFLRKLIAQNRTEEVKQLMYYSRYVDDLLVNETDGALVRFQSYIDDDKEPIYPRELKIQRSEIGRQLAFLDLWIFENSDHKRFVTRVFDKRSLAKYAKVPMSRFPHISSQLASRVHYGIVTSQCYRYMRICSYRSDFRACFLQLVQALRNKGYTRKRIYARLRFFVKQNLPFYHFISVQRVMFWLRVIEGSY